MLASDWYRARLEAQRTVDATIGARQAKYLEEFLARPNYADVAARLNVRGRLAKVNAGTSATQAPAYLEKLTGTLGAEPAIAAAMGKR